MSKEIEVTEDQLGAAFRLEAERHKKMIALGLFAGAMAGMGIVVKATPVDMGHARQGWAVRKSYDETGRPDGADLYNDAPHAGILEMGSRPHMPPFMPILRWVVRKFGLELGQKGKRSFNSLDEVPFQTKAAARSIQRKIAQRGTPAHRMVGKNLTELRMIAQAQVTASLRNGGK